jgi:hypothetical protein
MNFISIPELHWGLASHSDAAPSFPVIESIMQRRRILRASPVLGPSVLRKATGRTPRMLNTRMPRATVATTELADH